MWSVEGIEAAKNDYYVRRSTPKNDSESTVIKDKIKPTISKQPIQSSNSNSKRSVSRAGGTSLANPDDDGISRAQSALRRMSLANANSDEIGRAQAALAGMSIDGPRDNFDQGGPPRTN